MKSLIFIRHAKSSWDDAAVADFDRPLNKRGTNDADVMAKRLIKRIDKIDAFISSPALRAKTTAEKFITAYGKNKNDIIFGRGLYHSSEFYFGELINKIDDSFNTVAIFSHNPGITDFVNTLTASITTDNMPTCGIFAVKATIDSWKEFAKAKKDFQFYDYPKLVD